MTLSKFLKQIQDQISAAAIHLESSRVEKCAFVLGATYQSLEHWIEVYAEDEENDE